MFISLYKYKVESFFGDNIVPFDNNFLCYEFDSDKENNRYLCFKNEEGLQISSWDYLFNDYISGEYWKNTTTESLKEKCIPGFIDMDYSGVNLIINNMFFILDINKGIPFYRKELTNFYCQYQVSHYKGNDNTRLFFLKRLFGEMWIWNLAYDKLSIKNDELIFKAENGIDYHIHDVIDRLCDIIRAYSLPKHLSCILNFINPMLHECIDFILGKNAVYD
uniref:hypothetical protein n=1 Tax=Xenorhabdus sp. PB30.3 TaxID=2788941 RepID=UPI001E57B5EE